MENQTCKLTETRLWTSSLEGTALMLGEEDASCQAASALPAPRSHRQNAPRFPRSGGDDGNADGFLTATVSSQSKPVRIPSESIEVSRISPAPRASASRAHSNDAVGRRLCARPAQDLRVATGSAALGSRRGVGWPRTTLRARSCGQWRSISVGSARGWEFTLTLSAPARRPRRIASRANSTPTQKGTNSSRAVRARIEQRAAAFVRRGDVEQNDFVRAIAAMAPQPAWPDRPRR